MNEVLIVKCDDKTILEALHCCYLFNTIQNKIAVLAENEAMEIYIKQVLDFFDCRYTIIDYIDAMYELSIDAHEEYDCEADSYIMLYEKITGRKVVTDLSQVSVNSQDLIICISDDSLIQAIKYSVYTDRTFVYISDINEEIYYLLREATSILIFVGEELNVDNLYLLLEKKSLADNRVPIGIIYPFGVENRNRLIVKNYLYYMLDNSQKVYNFIYPLESISKEYHTNDDNVIMGKNLSVIKDCLTNKSEFTFAALHSNSVDMDMGNLVICAKEDCNEKKDLKRVLPCFRGANCSRITNNKELLSPQKIKTKILVLYTCWGAGLKNGIFDVESTILYSLSASPYCPVVVTTYTMSLLDRNAGNQMSELYKKGCSIGWVVGEYNRIHYEKYKDFRASIVLFGDPQIGLLERRSNNLITLQKEEEKNFGIEIFDKTLFKRLDYVDFILYGTERLKIEKLQNKIDILRESVAELRMFALLYNQRILNGNAKLIESRLRERKEQAFFRYQTSFGEFYKSQVRYLGGYIRFQVDNLFSEKKTGKEFIKAKCPYCNSLVITHKKRIPILGIEKRQRECLNCATIFDGDALFKKAEIECNELWSDREDIFIKIRLNKQLDKTKKRCYAMLVVEPFNKKDECWNDLYKESFFDLNGNEVDVCIEFTKMEIPHYVGKGSYYVNCLVCLDEAFAFLRRTIYRD